MRARAAVFSVRTCWSCCVRCWFLTASSSALTAELEAWRASSCWPSWWRRAAWSRSRSARSVLISCRAVSSSARRFDGVGAADVPWRGPVTESSLHRFRCGSDSDEGEPEPDAPNIPSLFPSTFGFTVCVDGEVEELAVSAAWARYETAPAPEGSYRSSVWRRVPMGGTVTVSLVEGELRPQALDREVPRVRGRARRFGGNWLVSLFLVNDQSGTTHQQQAWLFQAELSVTSTPWATPLAALGDPPTIHPPQRSFADVAVTVAVKSPRSPV